MGSSKPFAAQTMNGTVPAFAVHYQAESVLPAQISGPPSLPSVAGAWDAAQRNQEPRFAAGTNQPPENRQS